MPEPVTTPNSPAVTPPASQTTEPSGFTVPEKFAGKSPEDIAKAYVELESQYGKSQAAAKAAEAYSKYGSPDDVQRTIEWALQADKLIKEGQLVPAGQSKRTASAPESAPWEGDDWVMKSEGEKFNILQQRAIAEAQKYIDTKAGEYGKMIEGIASRDAREKEILVHAIEAARANPEMTISEVLEETATLAKKTPEEMMKLVLEARRNTPAANEAKLKKMVEERLQEELQKREAAQLADFSRATTPKTSSLIRAHREKDGFAAREAENRTILENLRKVGINPLT